MENVSVLNLARSGAKGLIENDFENLNRMKCPAQAQFENWNYNYFV